MDLERCVELRGRMGSTRVDVRGTRSSRSMDPARVAGSELEILDTFFCCKLDRILTVEIKMISLLGLLMFEIHSAISTCTVRTINTVYQETMDAGRIRKF